VNYRADNLGSLPPQLSQCRFHSAKIHTFSTSANPQQIPQSLPKRRTEWPGEHTRPRVWRLAPRRPLLPSQICFLSGHLEAM
jgi:hypothetical protein